MKKIIRIVTCKFEFLSEEAKKVAIEEYREEMYEGKHGSSDFPYWAIDDCSLFEPKHKVMTHLFGNDYYEKNGDQFVFKNHRKGVQFDDYDLDITRALEITNKSMFLTFLGISKEFHDRIEYSFSTGTSTEVELEYEYEGMKKAEFERMILEIKDGTRMFDTHIREILERIKGSVEWRYSDEAIEEELLDSEFDFELEGYRMDLDLKSYEFEMEDPI